MMQEETQKLQSRHLLLMVRLTLVIVVGCILKSTLHLNTPWSLASSLSTTRRPGLSELWKKARPPRLRSSDQCRASEKLRSLRSTV